MICRDNPFIYLMQCLEGQENEGREFEWFILMRRPVMWNDGKCNQMGHNCILHNRGKLGGGHSSTHTHKHEHSIIHPQRTIKSSVTNQAQSTSHTVTACPVEYSGHTLRTNPPWMWSSRWCAWCRFKRRRRSAVKWLFTKFVVHGLYSLNAGLVKIFLGDSVRAIWSFDNKCYSLNTGHCMWILYMPVCHRPYCLACETYFRATNEEVPSPIVKIFFYFLLLFS